ncbi:hypothetical protein [Knoellia sp. Soil729]|uniref:hypothetical protein n=1 Tax=Knoellia sp. Soil729 TaxID=1736394 RepID=UPI0006F1C514|nr:hypothetical protein [Knoellia sp. Soil729]KRE40851.1 hypothetical protein ASG74_15365 [Knoellia sp. Soil729]
MHTLHIEHAITAFPTWKAAFDRFADMRAHAGVRGQRIAQPVDDDHYVVIDLDFETESAAVSFREFLQTKVWAVPESSPGLAGVPVARILVLDGVEGGP